jgi:hypothetical protein
MDTEKLRKMNELSKELKMKGFADDSLKAIQQAEDIIGVEAPNDDSQELQMEQITPKSQINLSNNDVNLLMSTIKGTEQFKLEMDEKVKNISDNLNGLNQTVSQIAEKMNEIIKTINQLETRQKEVAERPVQQPQQKMSSTSNTSSTGSSEKKGEPMNQRTGNYTPDDVAIDKMFYFGNK